VFVATSTAPLARLFLSVSEPTSEPLTNSYKLWAGRHRLPKPLSQPGRPRLPPPPTNQPTYPQRPQTSLPPRRICLSKVRFVMTARVSFAATSHSYLLHICSWMTKKLIPTHDSSGNELLKVNQVWLSNFLVFGLLVVLYDLVVRVVNVFTQNF